MNNEWYIGIGLGGLIILLLILTFLYYFLKTSHNKNTRSAAQDILDRRYANGGIDKKEYVEKSRQIKEQANLA